MTDLAPVPATTLPTLPAVTTAALPPDRHPAAVYLASLADGPGRASMRSTLANVAAMLGTTIEACPWQFGYSFRLKEGGTGLRRIDVSLPLAHAEIKGGKSGGASISAGLI